MPKDYLKVRMLEKDDSLIEIILSIINFLRWILSYWQYSSNVWATNAFFYSMSLVVASLIWDLHALSLALTLPSMSFGLPKIAFLSPIQFVLDHWAGNRLPLAPSSSILQWSWVSNFLILSVHNRLRADPFFVFTPQSYSSWPSVIS